MIEPMRVFVLFILIVLFSPLQAMELQSRQLSDLAVVRLGMSAPLTGPSQELGVSLLKSIQLVFDQANAAQEIPGKQIELKVLDDQYNPDKTLQNTIQFLEKDTVDALFCYVGTPTVTRVLPLIRQQGNVMLYFPFTGAEPHRNFPYADFTYNFRASYYDETQALVDYFVAKGQKRIAVFYQIDAYGRNGWYGVKQALKRYGLPIVAEATYKRGQSFSDAYHAQVELLLKARPDAIIVIGSYQASAGFIRDVRVNNPELPIANISFVGAEALIHQLSEAPGADHHLVFSHVVPNPKISTSKAAVAFCKTTDKPSFIAFEGYLIAKLFVEMQKYPQAKTYDIGLEQPISFDASHQANNRVYLSTYERGLWTPIEDIFR